MANLQGVIAFSLSEFLSVVWIGWDSFHLVLRYCLFWWVVLNRLLFFQLVIAVFVSNWNYTKVSIWFANYFDSLKKPINFCIMVSLLFYEEVVIKYHDCCFEMYLSRVFVYTHSEFLKCTARGRWSNFVYINCGGTFP